MLNRRMVTSVMAAGAASLLAGGLPAGADASLALRLKEPGPLPERVFGDASAPVTIIEYASLSCGFCAKFHIETWPALKAKYVDTGKASFIIREFPLDPLAMAGFMLSRCREAQWYEIMDRLYVTKEEWAHSRQPVEAIVAALQPLGVTREDFSSCVTNAELYRSLLAVRERAEKTFGVNATPTFFINGAKHQGALTLAQFDAILGPLLNRPRP
jgi:protein-disulfide isomerase